MNYSDFQNQSASEKITLVQMNGTNRLMGWSLYSGSVYRLTNVPYQVMLSLEDSGTAYTAVTSIGAVAASKYFFDRSNSAIYVQASDSSNPNSRFLVGMFQFNFADAPVVTPYDLGTGYDVEWLNLVQGTSEFGVAIDTVNQTSEALEGSGSLTMINDQDFWLSNFDRLNWDNQDVKIYSYNRDLDPSDAQIIFKGTVSDKQFSEQTITFQLADQFIQLRATIPLATIGSLNARTGTDLATASQRMVLGHVFGHRPTNIDQVLDGYPVTGTVSIANGTTTITGSGTQFTQELSPNDQLVLNGDTFSIQSITDDSNLTLSNTYSGSTLSGISTVVQPDQPKRWQNRVHLVAGHAVREPSTTIQTLGSVQIINVVSTRDMYDGDWIYIGTLGSGELVKIKEVTGPHYIKLATSLATVPPIGTSVLRPAIQNLRIDDLGLTYYRDYTFDASTATLTLRDTAEANASQVFSLGVNLTFANTSKTVTGSGFQALIKAGYMIGAAGHVDMFEVGSVDSDTQITLKTAATFSVTAVGKFSSKIFDPDNGSVLTLDTLGRTDDGTTSGNLLKTAPSINKQLLTDAGLSASLDSASFTAAEDIAYQELGLVIPAKFDDTSTPIYRDVLNTVNVSVFGAIVQSKDYKFLYQVLRPKKNIATVFSEVDVLDSLEVVTTGQNIAKTAVVTYCPREYDYIVQDASVQTESNTNLNAEYVTKTSVEKDITTCLVNQEDAQIFAARWAMILQASTCQVKFTTKLQGMLLEIGNIIEISHRKLFDRLGSQTSRKLMMVESVVRSGVEVQITATDLSNLFNRVACINEYSTAWTSATDTEKLYGGYITDQYGLINNDPVSFETNLIW